MNFIVVNKCRYSFYFKKLELYKIEKIFFLCFYNYFFESYLR